MASPHLANWIALSSTEQRDRIAEASKNLSALAPVPRHSVRQIYLPLMGAIAEARARGVAWRAIADSLASDGLPPVSPETMVRWVRGWRGEAAPATPKKQKKPKTPAPPEAAFDLRAELASVGTNGTARSLARE